jgi:succinate-acetate transporter protein
LVSRAKESTRDRLTGRRRTISTALTSEKPAFAAILAPIFRRNGSLAIKTYRLLGGYFGIATAIAAWYTSAKGLLSQMR